MSGVDERPIETYSDGKEKFKCRRCHHKITAITIIHNENVWGFNYECSSCGYKGRKIRAEYKMQ